MTIGPLLFLAPLALTALLALPIVWWVLRATPPSPKHAELPSLRLLDGVEALDETPTRTPWWILLLRLAAAALVILGLALPVYAPGAGPTEPEQGPVLVVLDDGWASAARWSELRNAASATLDGAPADTAAHLLLTAPRTLNIDPSQRLSRIELDSRIKSLDPRPWPVDRAGALARLKESGLQPGRIVWLSDGLDPDSGDPFGEALREIAPLTIYAAPPRGPAAITGLLGSASGVEVSLYRAKADSEASHFVSALTLDGSALATATADFSAGSTEAIARFDLPPAALARIARFQVTGTSNAGTVWLWDSAARSRRIGLVSGDRTAQPLLSDMHYIRRALAPFSTIHEGDLISLIEGDPDAIILTDIGQIDLEAQTALIAWIEAGGALIRFAGPRLAARGDELVPTPLRRASRAIGGALTWEDPQPLGPFPTTSPFAGLAVPDNVTIRQQVLARPGPDLARRTWARLADGSPLVTADKRGAGMLVLFHVTAGPDWSDLPYSGVFVDMLRRAIAAGKGEAAAATDGLYVPTRTLNGYGQLEPPGADAAPLQADALADLVPSQTHPPGLYQGPSGARAVNIGATQQQPAMTNWPAGARLLGDSEAQTERLGGWLLSGAALLLLIDLLVALGIAGRLRRFQPQSAAAAIVLLALTLGTTGLAEAQSSTDKATEAALGLRLAYIETGDPDIDRTMRAGLEGLSLTLFNRSSVEPDKPHAVDPETDALDVYPLIFLTLPDTPAPLSPLAISRLNAYMRSGGAIFIDTRRGGMIGATDTFEGLNTALAGLDTPPLTPVPRDHVLSRSFYLLDDFPGRYSGRRLWIEETGSAKQTERRGDGVSRLFVGDADYLAAWAIDSNRRPLFSVDGGETQREMASRFGVNLVIYVLTGNYKEDQVHIPALLDRLGEDNPAGSRRREVIP